MKLQQYQLCYGMQACKKKKKAGVERAEMRFLGSVA
jgi:hypothetical protein